MIMSNANIQNVVATNEMCANIRNVVAKSEIYVTMRKQWRSSE